VIIKRKPKGVTAKAFIDEIMRNVQIQDGNWNKKVKSEIFCFFFFVCLFFCLELAQHMVFQPVICPLFLNIVTTAE